jgi:hypothetical protein
LKEHEKMALKGKLMGIHGQLGSLHGPAGSPIIGHTSQNLPVMVTAPGQIHALEGLIRSVEDLCRIVEDILDAD